MPFGEFRSDGFSRVVGVLRAGGARLYVETVARALTPDARDGDGKNGRQEHHPHEAQVGDAKQQRPTFSDAAAAESDGRIAWPLYEDPRAYVRKSTQ